MKNSYFVVLLLILPMACKNVAIQNQTSNSQALITTYNDVSDYQDPDDFSPGLLFFALIGFAFILVCVGAGIALTIFGLLAIFGLVATGILSASIVVGLNKKSFTLGFKTFLYATTTIGGFILGTAGFWALNHITHWWTLQTTLLTGSISGLLAGLAFGFFAFYVIQRLTSFFRDKWKGKMTI